MKKEKLSIMVVDDHPLFRNGIRTLLETVDGWEIAGEATTGEEAVALAQTVSPDLVLMDIQMPGMNGIDAIQELIQVNPEICILVLSMFEEDHMIFASIRAGARGYILKSAGPEQITSHSSGRK
jgi:DNA-binding NarL/FixJ family response regulator